MEENTWLDYISAIGSITTPILVLLLTAVGWKYRQAVERKLKLEEKLRDDRIEIYNQILEPFIILLMSDIAWQSDKRNKGKDKSEIAIAQMLSLDYRKTSFKLSLIGSDSVVSSFNNLMQYFYNNTDNEQNPSKDQIKNMMSLLGSFLLEIRKSMGNETTKIDNWGMLEWFITDAREMRSGTYL
ncbi:hypothetical protein [Sulfurimonas sp.]|uniref:hypothetical protein n=1 Tax=Sulfurimonas sp. TaxID=2022749 RepID=UPI003D113AEB